MTDKPARQPPPLAPVRASLLQGSPVPDREFHVDPFIPGRTVTLLSGDGGTGKSLLALQLAVATVTSTNWCGRRVSPGAAIYFAAEDDLDELHRRLAAISASLALELADLENLFLLPLADGDAVLGAVDGKSLLLKPTELATRLEGLVSQIRPRLLVIDTLADAFSGNENDRGQARQFIGIFRALAIRYDCAVVVLSHPSRAGLATGSGDSGSTAWSNSVRSRIYLDRVTEGEGRGAVEPDHDLRILRLMKANYGRTGVEVQLRWVEGVFETVDNAASVSSLSAIAARHRAEEVFLAMVEVYAAKGRDVSDKPASNFAPKVFAGDPSLSEGISKRGFHDAMNRLFAAGKIRMDESGPQSRPRRRMVVVHQPDPDG